MSGKKLVFTTYKLTEITIECAIQSSDFCFYLLLLFTVNTYFSNQIVQDK